MATRKSTQAAPAASVNESARIVLFQVQHQCAPLGTLILDLGARLGALDKVSRKVIKELLQELVDKPDEAPEIARLAGVLATVQKPMARNSALNRLLTLPDAPAFDLPKARQS